MDRHTHTHTHAHTHTSSFSYTDQTSISHQILCFQPSDPTMLRLIEEKLDDINVQVFICVLRSRCIH